MTRHLKINYFIHKQVNSEQYGCPVTMSSESPKWSLVADLSFDRAAMAHDLLDHDFSKENPLTPRQEECASLGAYLYRDMHLVHGGHVNNTKQAASSAAYHWRKAGQPTWYACNHMDAAHDESGMFDRFRDAVGLDMMKFGDFSYEAVDSLAYLLLIGWRRLADEFPDPASMKRALVIGNFGATAINSIVLNLYQQGCRFSRIDVRLSRKHGLELEVQNRAYSQFSIQIPF